MRERGRRSADRARWGRQDDAGAPAADRLGPQFEPRGLGDRDGADGSGSVRRLQPPDRCARHGQDRRGAAARTRALGDGRLLIVDDAHLLDRLSAALVYQLAVSGAAKLIVTVSPNGPVAEEISALWEDDLLERIDVQPPGHDDSRLAALVDEFIAALPAARAPGARISGRRRPAAARPTCPHSPAMTAVAEAQASGAMVVDGDRVRPAHPLFVDAVRDALGGPELRRLRTELVDRLAAAPARDVVDDLRLAVLALDSDRPQPTADLVRAAERGAATGRPGAVRTTRSGRGAARAGVARPADPGLRAGVAGPRPGRRFGARRGGSVRTCPKPN